MSIIGTLGQYNLSSILQQAEAKAKTGLLIIEQGQQRVELSFRQGQLMCIGPMRSNKTLGERLLQAGVISQQAFQEVSYTLGASQRSETRTAISLIDLGYLNQESLYTWAAREATRVLEVLLSWTSGEIYFGEGLQPPTDRLLIALSLASLLPQRLAVSTQQPISVGVFSTQLQARSKGDTTTPAISDAQTLHDASQFFDASARSSTSADLNLGEVPVTDVVRNTDALSQSSAPFTSLKVATEPVSPRRFDISQMQPQMILTPTDLSGLRERNPRIQLTPEQWRLLTQADGKTSLQMACQLLVMPREQVCQAAGELFELGLVTITLPTYGAINDQSPIPLDLMNADLGHSHPAQVYDKSSNPFSPAPVETHSQWGNGGNGATFILGGGWVVSSSPSHSLQSGDQYSSSNNLYAQAGRAR